MLSLMNLLAMVWCIGTNLRKLNRWWLKSKRWKLAKKTLFTTMTQCIHHHGQLILTLRLDIVKLLRFIPKILDITSMKSCLKTCFVDVFVDFCKSLGSFKTMLAKFCPLLTPSHYSIWNLNVTMSNFSEDLRRGLM